MFLLYLLHFNIIVCISFNWVCLYFIYNLYKIEFKDYGFIIRKYTNIWLSYYNSSRINMLKRLFLNMKRRDKSLILLILNLFVWPIRRMSVIKSIFSFLLCINEYRVVWEEHTLREKVHWHDWLKCSSAWAEHSVSVTSKAWVAWWNHAVTTAMVATWYLIIIAAESLHVFLSYNSEFIACTLELSTDVMATSIFSLKCTSWKSQNKSTGPGMVPPIPI